MKHVGIIDIGSNSIRYVTYFISNGHLRKEVDEKKFVKLQSHVTKGVLGVDGQDLLVNSLKELLEIKVEKKLDALHIGATAAIRGATNQEEVLLRVKQELNLDIEIISGDSEAYYGFIATKKYIKETEGLIVDLGGGSIELTHYFKGQIINSISLPLGVLAIKQKFCKGIMPTLGELSMIRTFIHAHLSELSWLENAMGLPVIAIGGTARNLVKVKRDHYKLKMKLHHYKIKYQALLDLKNEIILMDKNQLESYPSFSVGRHDTIGVGAIVFVEILKYLESPVFILNRYGIREGIILDKEV